MQQLQRSPSLTIFALIWFNELNKSKELQEDQIVVYIGHQ